MTIGSTSPARVSFNCDGSTKVFPVPIQAYQNTDLTVILTAPAGSGGTETTLILNSDYGLTASGTLQPTAWTLTTLAPNAYAAGYTLQVFTNPVQQQQTQYIQGQAFPSLAVQANMDRLTQMVQRLQDQINRSIRAPDGDVSPGMLLPVAVARALQYAAFDAGGNAIVVPALPGSNITPAGIGATLFPQTTAETGAGVVPTALNFPEAFYLSGAQRFGADPTGAADATVALQNWANGCGGVMIFPPNATFLVRNTINIPAGTSIFGNGSTLNADPNYWSSTPLGGAGGWNMLNGKGSILIQGLNFTVPAVSRNTIWKAVDVDNTVQTLPAGSRVIVRDCVLTNIDVGVYVDGGITAFNVDYMEVSGCNISINTLGTGGINSIRPTVNPSNCKMVRILGNNLLTNDTVFAVNNIYGYSSQYVEIRGNVLQNGQMIKLNVNAGHPAQHYVIAGNRFVGGVQAVVCILSDQLRTLEITNNLFDGQNPGANDGLVDIQTGAAVTGDALEALIGTGNYVRSCATQVWYPQIQAGNTFGALVLTGNTYYNVSTGSAGTYPIVNLGSLGSYRSFSASNETILGNSVTRDYVAGAGILTQFLNFPQLRNIQRIATVQAIPLNAQTVTLTLTGVTTLVTVTATYTVEDGVATISVPSAQGTSSAGAPGNACTLTGLPAALVPATTSPQTAILANDNGVLVGSASGVASAEIVAASTTITLLKNGSTNGWTSGGAKGPLAFTMSYPLA